MKDKQAKYPQLRFKGFTDPWEQRRLKDVVEKQIKGKAQFEKLAPGEVEYLDTSRLNGGQAILTNGLKDVTLDDILILWDGSKAGTVYHGFEGALGSTLKAYRTSANSKFVYQYLKRHQDNIYNNYRTPNIPHVQKDFLNVFTISVPVSDEQEKIGSFFKQLDDTIDLHQRKLAKLKELKQGYLQKMFPKNGSKFPQLRFSGFADAWEQRNFGELYKKNLERNKDQFSSDRTISIATMRFKKEGNGAAEDSLVSYKVLREGDIAFEGHTSKRFAFGRFVLNDIGDGIMSPRFTTLRPTQDMPIKFWKQYIHYEPIMRYPIVNSTKLGTMMNELVVDEFLNQPVLVPELSEQQKIGSFFKQLDGTITLHQRKLEKLQELKKGYLQKMFCWFLIWSNLGSYETPWLNFYCAWSILNSLV